MMIGVQWNPPRRPAVVLGIDAEDPARLRIRPRLLASRGLWALLLLAGGALGQLEAIRKGSGAGFAAATLLAWGGAGLALHGRRVTLDRKRGRLEEWRGFLLPVRRRVRPLADFQRVVVSSHEESASQGASTAYRVRLEGAAEPCEIASPGYWEPAIALAEHLARFLGLPLEDVEGSGTRAAVDLDRPLRERATLGPRAHRPGQAGSTRPPEQRNAARPGCAVLADEPHRLLVRIPRYAVLPMGCLVGVVAAFVTIPATIELVIPWLRGTAIEPRSLAWFLLPIVIVGVPALKIALTQGGELHVHPGRLRLDRNGPFGPRREEIPSGELEDVVLLDPEVGGSRSLLWFFSDGVLAARSDRTAIRFGYGLPRAELEWLHVRILEVVRAGTERARATGSTEPIPARVLPAVYGWRWPAAGLAVGAMAGNAATTVLSRGIAVPFLEHAVTVGGALGWLAGLAGHRARRRAGRVALAGPALPALALLALLGAAPGGLVGQRPQHDEALGLRRSFALQSEERAFLMGWLPTAALTNAVALDAALLGWDLFRRRRRDGVRPRGKSS